MPVFVGLCLDGKEQVMHYVIKLEAFLKTVGLEQSLKKELLLGTQQMQRHEYLFGGKATKTCWTLVLKAPLCSWANQACHRLQESL